MKDKILFIIYVKFLTFFYLTPLNPIERSFSLDDILKNYWITQINFQFYLLYIFLLLFMNIKFMQTIEILNYSTFFFLLKKKKIAFNPIGIQVRIDLVFDHNSICDTNIFMSFWIIKLVRNKNKSKKKKKKLSNV